MTDLPPGKFTLMMIGPYWPGGTSVTSTVNAARNRGTVRSFYEDYTSQLATTRTGPLAPLEGAAAESLRGMFVNGETQASSVADRNSVKQKAFADTAQALNDLRSDLTQIAAEGNAKIDEIQQSKTPFPLKLAAIIGVISEKQGYAAHKSAQYGAKVMEAMQQVLTAQGDGRSPEKFAADNGVNLGSPPTPPNKDTLRGLVEPMLNGTSSSADTKSSHSTTEGFAAAAGAPLPPGSSTNPLPQKVAGQQTTEGFTGQNASFAPPGSVANLPAGDSKVPTNVIGQNNAAVDSQLVPGITSGGTLGPAASGIPTTAGPTTLPTATTALPSVQAPSVPSAPAAPSIPTVSAPSVPSAPAFGPQQLAESFNHGMQSGGPISGGAQALSQGALDAAFHPAVVQQPDFAPAPTHYSTTTTPTAGGHLGFETAHAVDSTYAAPTPADNSATMYAAPAAAAPIAPSAVPSVGPAGPLPTYGSDLRPPTPTVAAPAPPPVPAAAAPTSAPSSGAGALNQQPLVRQQPAAAQPSVASAPGITESALTATASGALVGATAEEAAARARLRNLVEAVARQEPKLRWAVGKRDDGTTLLVTDLACGWIPPHVEIPTGVQILTPAPRRGGLEDLLGAVALAETWIPGQYLPAEKDVAPVPMSIRSRDLPSVNDLNWEITQATNWRDGLPRLAHTLAKAGVAGTGVLDSEGELLREHLHAISERVRNAYPSSVDIATVGNWQLLAAIDALVTGRRTSMNYHFAWFQQLQMATQGGPQ